jgi:hypothetical protein
MMKPYPGTTVTPETRWHSDLGKVEILDGYLLTVSFVAASTVTASHALGRSYRGALMVASTSPNIMVVPLAPATASANGTDIKKKIPLTASSSWTGSVTLWVF